MKYNGWTNYATWRVNLEQVDDLSDHWQESLDAMDMGYTEEPDNLTYELQKMMKEEIEENLFLEDHGIVGSYCQAFLEHVNWYEIAKHQVEEYIRWRTEKHPNTSQTC